MLTLWFSRGACLLPSTVSASSIRRMHWRMQWRMHIHETHAQAHAMAHALAHALAHAHP